MFWSLAVVYGFFAWNAQRTGTMFLTRRRELMPPPPDEVEWANRDAAPPRLLREDDPKRFRDAMVFRWWVVGTCAVIGAGFVLAQWLGMISNMG